MILQYIKLEIKDIKEKKQKKILGIRDYVELLKAILTYVLSKNQFWSFIYEEVKNGELIGYCIMRDDTIAKMLVKEEYRGKGLGRKLVPSYARCVMARKSSISFYEKLGFRIKDGKNYFMVRE